MKILILVAGLVEARQWWRQLYQQQQHPAQGPGDVEPRKNSLRHWL